MPNGHKGELSARETALLELLANGHTVKTAIAETGDTEAAAHELLRSARRKLGVGSSREAARLYFQERPTQKTSDSFSVIGNPARSTSLNSLLVTGGIMLAVTVSAMVFATGFYSEAQIADNQVKVESTLPVEGAEIEPGPFVLRVTFDRPMIGQIKSVYSPASEGSIPLTCQGPPEITEDRKSFEQLCIATAGATHQVWFGHEDMGGFRSEDGQSPKPLLLTFSVEME